MRTSWSDALVAAGACAAAITALAVSAPALHAQEVRDTTPEARDTAPGARDTALQARDTVRLREVVVTATRLPTDPDAAVAAQTVVTGEELRARGVRFVHDAIRDVPGAGIVQVGSFGGVTSLFLRGGESDYVKVLVDGVPLNQPGGSYDFAHLTTENLDRIEVVRGPTSVLYGSDAVTGVVQVFTRRGEGQTQVEGEFQGGGFGSTIVDARAGGGGGRASYSVGVSRFDTDGTYDFNNQYRNTVVNGLFRAEAGTGTDATLSVRYRDATAHFPTQGGGLPVDRNQFTLEDGLALGLDLGQRLSSRLEARLALAANEVNTGYDDQQDDASDASGFAFASTRASDVYRRSADLRLNLFPTAGVSLTAGAQLEREREQLESETTSDFGDGPFTEQQSFDERRRTFGYYAQGIVDLESGLAVNLGARVDDTDTFGTFFTYRTGIAYRLPSRTRMRASIGTGFKSPIFCEQFCVTPFEVGDPSLRPERSVSWEAGAEQPLFEGRIVAGATYFDQRFRDLIQYSFTEPGVPTYANLAAADARGIETSLTALPVATLTLLAQYTYLDTEVTDAGASMSAAFADGERLLRRPTHSGRLGARYRFIGRASVAANVLFVGARDDADFGVFPTARVVLPAHQVVDVSATVDVLPRRSSRPGVTLTMRLENLLQERYESVVGFPGRRRALFVGARVGL